MALYNMIGPGDDEKKKKASEKVVIRRMLDKPMRFDNKTADQIIRSAAKKTGVNPDFLAANAFQEGMNKAIISGNKNVPSDEFPVDGFLYYGLDTFGSVAPELMAKGYLPKDFKFSNMKAENEKGTSVNSASFKTNEDALVAKGAYLNYFKDQVKSYANKIGVPLTKDAENYLTMSAYNGGMGNAKIMIDELATGYNPEVFIREGKTSRKGVHKNIAPRVDKMETFKELRNKRDFGLGGTASLLESLWQK